MIRRLDAGQRAGRGPVEAAARVIRMAEREEQNPRGAYQPFFAIWLWLERLYPNRTALLNLPPGAEALRAIAPHLPPDPARARLLPGLVHLSYAIAGHPTIDMDTQLEHGQTVIDWALATRPNLFAFDFATALQAATAWHNNLELKANATAIKKALSAHLPEIETPYGTWHRFSGRAQDLPHLQTFGKALGHCYQHRTHAEHYGLSSEHFTLIKNGHLLAAVTWSSTRLLDAKGPQNAPISTSSDAGRALPWLVWDVRRDSVEDFLDYFDSSPAFPSAVLAWRLIRRLSGFWRASLHTGFKGPVHTSKIHPGLTPKTAAGATHLCLATNNLREIPKQWAAPALAHFKRKGGGLKPPGACHLPRAVLIKRGPVDLDIWIPLDELTAADRRELRRGLVPSLDSVLGYTHAELELLGVCVRWGDCMAAGDTLNAAYLLNEINYWHPPDRNS